MASRRVSIFINGKEVANTIKSITEEKKKLGRELKLLTVSSDEYNKKAAELKRVNAIVKEHRDGLKSVESVWKKAGQAISGFAAIAGVAGVAELSQEIQQLVKDMTKLRGEVQQLTSLSGDGLDAATARLKGIADTYDKEVNEVLTATNNFAKQTGISFEESLGLVEKGFLTGADSSGQFLKKLEEYPVQLKAFGSSAEDIIKLTAEETLGGFYNDKLIDGLKEINLSLKEMGKLQREALTPLGNTFADELAKDIASGAVTSEQALLKIAKQGEKVGLNYKQIQTIVADVFKGAGEDAGGFEKVIGAVMSASSKSLDDYIDTSNDLVRQQQQQLQVNQELANAQNELTKELGDTVAQVGIFGKQVQTFLIKVLLEVIRIGALTIETFKAIPQFVKENKVEIIGLSTALVAMNANLIISKTQLLAAAAAAKAKAAVDKATAIATNVMAAAQRGLNTAMRANPIGLIITALGLLAAAFAAAYKRSQTLRAGVAGLMNVAREVGTILKDIFGNFAKGFQSITEGNILQGLKEIGTGIAKANPVSIAFNEGGRLKKAFADGFNEKVELEAKAEFEETIKRGQEIIAQQESKNTSTTTSSTTNNDVDVFRKGGSVLGSTQDQKMARAASKQRFKEQQKEAEAIKNRTDQLNKFLLEKAEELRLAQLDEETKRIEQVKAEYQSRLDTVTKGSEQEQELLRLRGTEIKAIEAEFADQRKQQAEEKEREHQEALEAIQSEINERLKTEEELEILAVEEKYQKLLEQARQFGFDIQEVEEAQQLALAEINAKYLNQEIADAKEAAETRKKIEDKEQSERRARNDEILSNFQSAFGGIEDVLSKYQEKQVESGKISEEQAEKIQKVMDGLFLAQKAIAAAEIIINLQRELSAIATANAPLGPVGVPLTIAQSAAASIRAATGLATIASTTIQRFAQRKEGGYFNAIGEDDGRTYNAQYVGRPSGGMLPSGPKLVLANEAGPEYFVPNNLLRIPRVFNAVQAIESIRTGRRFQQFQEGGFTDNRISNRDEFVAEEDSMDAQLLAALESNTETNAQLAGTLKVLVQEMKKPRRAYVTQRDLSNSITSINDFNQTVGNT